MTIATNLQRIIDAKAAIKAAIAEKGVEVPDAEKLDTYYSYIDQIGGGGGGYDPDNPTVDGLKNALNAGDFSAFPANSVIPDTYNGQAFNWIVGHYGTATMADGSTKEGVYLFADHIVQRLSLSSGSDQYYNNSRVNTWLNDTFLTNCSDTMQSIVGEIQLPVYTDTTVNAKMWSMSIAEVMGQDPAASTGGGVPWDAWKDRTHLSSPSTSSNSGRVMKESNGSAYYWWLRSYSNPTTAWCVNANGSISTSTLGNPGGILPACFIAKDTSEGYDPSNPTLEALKAALDAGDYEAFPANTLIPDKYGETDINWVVGHYGTATMADGSTKEGVYLFKDKALNTQQTFGSSSYYDESTINTYLNDT